MLVWDTMLLHQFSHTGPTPRHTARSYSLDQLEFLGGCGKHFTIDHVRSGIACLFGDNRDSPLPTREHIPNHISNLNFTPVLVMCQSLFLLRWFVFKQ
jgi:hypothetical protein